MALLTCAAWGITALAQDTVFGDWEKVCDDDGACRLSQITQLPGKDDIVLQSDFSVSENGGILLSIRVPAAIDLRGGPWMTVDGLYVAELDYVTCASNCQAVAGFSPNAIDGLLAGTNGLITVVGLGGGRIGLPMSLNGLSEGLRDLSNTR